MLSVIDIIQEINSSFKDLKGVWQGVAELVTREDKTMPVINEKHCGVDDVHPIVAYHRLGTLTSAKPRPVDGYGRETDIANTYSNSLVVFVNTKRTKMYPDEVFLYLQANMPERIALPPYKSVVLNVRDVIMASQNVWNQEYSANSPYRLKPEQYLFKINYQIEATFKRGCFAKCN